MKPRKATKAYLCATDFTPDISWPIEADFPKLYRSLADLKLERSCWRDCGIYQVEVKFKRVVKRGSI